MLWIIVHCDLVWGPLTIFDATKGYANKFDGYQEFQLASSILDDAFMTSQPGFSKQLKQSIIVSTYQILLNPAAGKID